MTRVQLAWDFHMSALFLFWDVLLNTLAIRSAAGASVH